MSIIDMLTGTWWVAVALGFIAIVAIVALCQYGIKNGRLIKKYGDALYFILSAAAALTISVLLVVESHAGIIQLLDNALRGNESPLLSGLLLGPTAMVFGGMFGFALIILSEAIATFRKRSLIKKLRQAKPRYRIRRRQPTSNQHPSATRPTRCNAVAHRSHSTYAVRVSTGQGMRRC